MSTSSIPAALRSWLKGQYPTLSIRDSWLLDAVRQLRRDNDRITDSALIKATNEQLLDADLKVAAECGSLPRPNAAADSSTRLVGAGARGAVLVQIVGKLDIGVSAQVQLDVLEARKAARSTVAGKALLEGQANKVATNGSHRSADVLNGGVEDHMADFNSAEEAATLPATVFPRSTLQLELSDGYTTFKAIEHKRIAAISMADTPLGAKLLLKNVKALGDLLMLTPETVVLKGGHIEALESTAEANMINALRAKLGKAPLPTTGPRHRAQRNGQAHDTGRATAQRIDRPSSSLHPTITSSLDEFADDEEIFAQLHEELGPTGGASEPVSVPADTPATRADSTTSRFFRSGGRESSRRTGQLSQGGTAIADAIELSDSE